MFTGKCGLEEPIEREGSQGEREGDKKRGEGGRKKDNFGTEISSNLSLFLPSISLTLRSLSLSSPFNHSSLLYTCTHSPVAVIMIVS